LNPEGMNHVPTKVTVNKLECSSPVKTKSAIGYNPAPVPILLILH
jgi:hypothetical protein